MRSLWCEHVKVVRHVGCISLYVVVGLLFNTSIAIFKQFFSQICQKNCLNIAIDVLDNSPTTIKSSCCVVWCSTCSQYVRIVQSNLLSKYC